MTMKPSAFGRSAATMLAAQTSAPAATIKQQSALSHRQAEIANLLLAGKRSREIAEALCLSPRTIEHHLEAIFNKLGVRSRVELVAALLRPRLRKRVIPTIPPLRLVAFASEQLVPKTYFAHRARSGHCNNYRALVHLRRGESRISLTTRFTAAISALLMTLTVAVLLPARSLARSALPVLYVSDNRTKAINVFRLDDGRRVGSIAYPMNPGGERFAAGPGIATDAQNNLWATFTFDDGHNYPGKVVIYGYAPGQFQWFTAIAGGCCGTPNLAVSNVGEIAEALGYFPPYYAGGVGFIEPGKKFVGRYNTALPGIVYDAYDGLGTLWVAGVDERFKPHFGFIRRGSRVFEEVHCDPKTYLGPVAVDTAGHMLVDNDQNIYAYDSLGRLIYRVALTGAVDIANIALSHDGNTLYVANTNGTILAYRFPEGGKPIAEYDVGGSPRALALGSIFV